VGLNILTFPHLPHTTSATIPMNTIEVGYWSIKGLGAPLRMMVMYAGYPLQSSNFDLKINADGGYDGSEWFTKKPELKEANPLINLPYVKDGDKIISQSNACFLYLGRKFNMLGSTTSETEACEQLLCEIMDLRNKMTGFCYNPASDAESVSALLKDVSGSNGALQKIELWLKKEITTNNASGAFLVGDHASAPDFHLYEMLDQYQAMARFYNLPSPTATFPLLASFKDKFEALPENSKYLASPLSKMPFNNKMAAFGACANGEKWTIGMTYDFGDLSGVY
jgi:glutathione S-transferase